MKSLAIILTSLIIAFWVVAIAILSVQNATPVSLRFLAFQSVQIPVGLILAFSVGLGIICTAFLQTIAAGPISRQRTTRLEEDAEFFVDDEDF
jgi:uncharacterized integral membrane protein